MRLRDMSFRDELGREYPVDKELEDRPLILRLTKLRAFVDKELSELLLSRITAYEDATGDVAEHVKAEDVLAVQKVLADKIFVALYLGFTQGHSVGAMNDKARLESLLRIIIDGVPQQVDSKIVVQDMLKMEDSNQDNTANQLAGFTRGYNQALHDILNMGMRASDMIKGTPEEDFEEAIKILDVYISPADKEKLKDILT